MESNREPYPFPKLENDDTFRGKSDRKKTGTNPTNGDPTNEDPLNTSGGDLNTSWDRLHNTKTLASKRKEVFHYDPVAPKDNLDFVLRCQYNHQLSFMSSKAEMILQPETAGCDHGRVLKNRDKPVPIVTLENKKLVSYNEPRKTTLDSAKGLSIESHHSEATNRGYSRKDDGGFY